MKWVTSDHLHMDRVATLWLIHRFIDSQAELTLVPIGQKDNLPSDAEIFGIAGVGIGAHDSSGSAFRKVMKKFSVKDPALDCLADLLESGIDYAVAKIKGQAAPKLQHDEGVGLDAMSAGMMFLADDDMDNMRRSRLIYDALYEYCRAELLIKENKEIAALSPLAKWQRVRAELRSTAKAQEQGSVG